MKPSRQRELRLACLFLVSLALGACQGEEKPAETTPQGEVLPASVSDAMLPLDTIRSQPPFAPLTEAADPPARSTAGGGATEAAGDDEDDAERPTAALTPAPPAAPPSISPETAP